MYLRSILLGGQKEELYEETDTNQIARAFRRAGKAVLHGKNSYKVVLFIVEGPTDEDAFRSVMKKLHARQQVVFLVIHGDITADRDVNARNAMTAVNQKIKELMRKYGLHRTDLLKIIHLVDMDSRQKGQFRGAHVVGWVIEAVAISLFLGAAAFCVQDGIRRGFGQFFVRFMI